MLETAISLELLKVLQNLQSLVQEFGLILISKIQYTNLYLFEK